MKFQGEFRDRVLISPRPMPPVLAAIAALCVLAVSPAPRAMAASPMVQAQDGTFQGVLNSDGTVREFLGIRYAAPPVGNFRWRPPQSPAHPTGTVDATHFGNHCAQPPSQFGNATLTEDCLFLNVFAPNDDGHEHPVMLWIHGGALVVGESNEFDATKLAKEGAIVVTINYRLGALGFLAHPALSAESADHVSGNYGIEDQQFALQWVRRNIRQFGGDPQKVTVFGESAGGLSTLVNVASPTAKGLFHRAIVESGSYQLTQPTLAQYQALGVNFAHAEGCNDPNQADAQTAACLRALTVLQVLTDQAAINVGLGPAPNVDGKVLQQSIRDALAGGQFNRVPMINGTNHDEQRLFVPLFFGFKDNVVPDAQATFPGAIPYSVALKIFLGGAVQPADFPKVLAQYPSGNTPLSANVALAAAATDAVFTCPAHFIDELASRFTPVFAYEFNDENAPQNFLPPVVLHDNTIFPYGASHASEIQYLFPFANPSGVGLNLPQTPLNAAQLRLSDQMIDYWTRHARAGNPNGSDTRVFWPRFETDDDDVQSLTTPRPFTETSRDPAHDLVTVHKCAFWDQIRGFTVPAQKADADDMH